MSKIVVCDDSYSELQIIEGYLKAANHTVVTYPNTDKLEDKLATEKPDLVILDVVMPGMGGRELAERLARFRPELPVLFTSGYTDGEIVRRGLLEPGAAFVQKPFTPDGIVRSVRERLDAASLR